MEINGVAHVMLTVSNFEACYPFYEKLLMYLGLKPVMRSEEHAVLRRRKDCGGNHARRRLVSRGEIPAAARRAASRMPARARAWRRR